MTYDEVIEAALKAVYDDHPHTILSEALSDATGLPIGAPIPRDVFLEHGGNDDGLQRMIRSAAPLLMEYGARLMREAAAKAASTAGSRPVGGGDGSTYTSGTSQDAAHAIRVLDPATIVKDASNG